MHNDLIVGAAIGYGSDRSTIGTYGTRSDATSVSGAIYASYSAFDPWFIDGMIGYGQLDYANQRFVSDDAITVAGNRKGSYWFGAASVGYEFKYRRAAYVALCAGRLHAAKLDGYSEQGASAER